MTDERLAQIRELAEKATPAPWTTERVEYPAGQDVSFEVQSGRDCHPVVQTYMREYRTEKDRISADAANAAFIAEARTAIPELLTLLDEQKKRIERLQQELRDLREDTNPAQVERSRAADNFSREGY